MTKYTLVFAFVFVICAYKTAITNAADDKPAAGATTGQGLANKPTATAPNNPTVNKGKQESDEESEESEEEPKKPATTVPKPVTTAPKPIQTSAAKPAATDQTKTTTPKSDDESDEYSDEEPAKPAPKPVQTQLPKPVQTQAPKPVQTGTKVNGAMPQRLASPTPTNVNNVKKYDSEESDESYEDSPEIQKKPTTTVTPKPTKHTATNGEKAAHAKPSAKASNGRHVEENSEEHSDDTSDATNKYKYQAPIVYYTQDSEADRGHRKAHRLSRSRSHSAADTAHRGSHRKPININIPITIY